MEADGFLVDHGIYEIVAELRDPSRRLSRVIYLNTEIVELYRKEWSRREPKQHWEEPKGAFYGRD